MKVLLCENSYLGHRKKYLECLSGISGIEFFVFAPKNVGLNNDHFFLRKETGKPKTIKEYINWIIQIKRIIKKINIDVVHILDGDSIMRYFGFSLAYLGTPKVIITYHHFFEGFVRKISYCMMSRNRNSLCIVHTESVQYSFQAIGIKNVARCEYPAFDFDSISQKVPEKCKKEYGVPLDVPVIGIVGGLCAYKNIIPFLEAMSNCKHDFHILICGEEYDITKEQIKKSIKLYEDKVTLVIRRLSNKEYEQAIVASDIIFCIYGHEFDGASGPLTDGVCANKLILSCKHGSLGEIVLENHLGFTAECSDRNELIRQTELALCKSKNFKYDETAEKYREQLQPMRFQLAYKNLYQKIYNV